MNVEGRNVLIVFAHPDDESYGPGATLASLAMRGARLTLLVFTRGEQSTLGVGEGGIASGPEHLAEIRQVELRHAAAELGIAEVRQHRYPDGGLAAAQRDELERLVLDALDELDPALIVTFNRGGISGHGDHITACEVAVAATAEWAERRGVPPPPVYGWAMPSRIAAILKERLNRDYPTTPDEQIVAIKVGDEALAAQWRAVMHHQSQHQPPPWPFEVRREVQAGYEFLERMLPDGPMDPEPILAALGLASGTWGCSGSPSQASASSTA